MSRRGDGDELFIIGSKMPIKVLSVLEWNERVLFPMNDERWHPDLLNHYQAFLIDGLQIDPFRWNAQMANDPDHTGETTLNDDPSQSPLRVVGQFDC